MSSAENFCEQFGPRSGPTKCRARSEFKLFDTLMVFLKEFFGKIDFEKNEQTSKMHAKLPSKQSFRVLVLHPFSLNVFDQSKVT